MKKKEGQVDTHIPLVSVPVEVLSSPPGSIIVPIATGKYVVFNIPSEMDPEFVERCLALHTDHILETKAAPKVGSQGMADACVRCHYLGMAQAYALSVRGEVLRGSKKIAVLQKIYPFLGWRFLDEPAELSHQVMEGDAEAEHQPQQVMEGDAEAEHQSQQVMPGGDEAKPKPKGAGVKKRAVVQSDSD